jgi:dihydroflavonol-4-reductase
MWFGSEKAKRELGYTARPAAQALKDAADWYKSNGYVRVPAAA